MYVSHYIFYKLWGDSPYLPAIGRFLKLRIWTKTKRFFVGLLEQKVTKIHFISTHRIKTFARSTELKRVGEVQVTSQRPFINSLWAMVWLINLLKVSNSFWFSLKKTTRTWCWININSACKSHIHPHWNWIRLRALKLFVSVQWTSVVY